MVDSSPDDSETPATLKMPTPPSLSQRKNAYEEELTALLRAKGFLPENETVTAQVDESGRVTSIEFSAVSYDHAMNLARRQITPKMHDPENPNQRSKGDRVTFGELSAVEFLDNERELKNKAKKSRTDTGTPNAR